MLVNLLHCMPVTGLMPADLCFALCFVSMYNQKGLKCKGDVSMYTVAKS